MEQNMQAFALIQTIEESQNNHKERCLAIQYYLSFLAFTIEEMKTFSKSIAFQIYQIPETATHAVTLKPLNIKNLNNSNNETTWEVEVNVYTSLKELHKALVSNLTIIERLIPLFNTFATKHSLSYNTNLEVVDFDELNLTITFGRILSDDC